MLLYRAMRTRESESLIVYIFLFFAAFGSLWLAWQTFIAVHYTNQATQESISKMRQPAKKQQDIQVKAATLTFRDGVNSAMEAATLTQTATTFQEWTKVAKLWQQAIAAMGSVPETDPNYTTAQQKQLEYQKNLEYAQKRAVSQSNATPKP